MVTDKLSDRQLFIATHSGDVLRGILDSDSQNVRVIRLRRMGDFNVARELNNTRLQELWKDPLLRYSNVLDGLFHEKVVLCESDSDCRFYAAVMDALNEDNEQNNRRPDIMFTHCGGKARLPVVIRSLKELDVPIAVVVDFDILSDERPLRDIFEATGGSWESISSDWRYIKDSIDAKKPELSTDEVKKDIISVLDSLSATVFPMRARQQIQSILRRSSPWSHAKEVGIAFLPNGQPSQICKKLLEKLQEFNIFVVPVGELEGFVKTVGGHGPSWVNEAIQKNIANDDELREAREFVSKII